MHRCKRAKYQDVVRDNEQTRSKDVMMRLLTIVAVSTFALSALAADDPVSRLGLVNGDYCSSEGLKITVAAPDYLGIMMVHCKDPKLANGKLTANHCLSMAEKHVTFEASFRATGDTIVSDGTTYRLTPERKGKLPCEVVSDLASNLAPPNTTAGSGWSTWYHNGSTMIMNDRTGRIAYEKPKSAIAGTVRPGEVLFEGRFEGKRVTGTAYVFKKGCAPAPYAVTGRIADHPRGFGEQMILTGAAPKRDKSSCAIIGTTATHSRLIFDDGGDV